MVLPAFTDRCPDCLIHPGGHCPECGSGVRAGRGLIFAEQKPPYLGERLVDYCRNEWHGDEGREYYERLMKIARSETG